MCSISILKFVSSNRIDRLEVRIVFHEGSEIYVKSQGVFVSTVILSSFLSIIAGFLCSELHHYPFLGFFGYSSFVIIHILLSIYYYI